MRELTELDLANNSVQDLSALENCGSLTILDISTNQVVDLQPVGNLLNLQRLYFGRNQIRDLTPIASLIEGGLVIKSQDVPSASDNPLTVPPPEVVSRGASSISTYFSEIDRQGSDELYEAKKWARISKPRLSSPILYL